MLHWNSYTYIFVYLGEYFYRLISEEEFLCWIVNISLNLIGTVKSPPSSLPFAVQHEYVSGSSDNKESACNAEDPGSIPGSWRSLEKGMATHSNILAWRIPWTEEPGGLQSMGSQRVGHDWLTHIWLHFCQRYALSFLYLEIRYNDI